MSDASLHNSTQKEHAQDDSAAPVTLENNTRGAGGNMGYLPCRDAPAYRENVDTFCDRNRNNEFSISHLKPEMSCQLVEIFVKNFDVSTSRTDVSSIKIQK